MTTRFFLGVLAVRNTDGCNDAGFLPQPASCELFKNVMGAEGGINELNDIIKTYNFLGHTPIEVTIIVPPQFEKDQNAGVRDCVWVNTVDEFISLCKRWNGKANIYVGLNERDPGFQPSSRHRAKKSNIMD